MSAEIHPEEHSKRKRIINGLAAYPDRYERDASVIAELVDASTSYVYRILDDIDASELTEDDIEAARDDELQDHYRQRLGELLEKHDIARSIDDAREGERASEEPSETEQLEPASDVVPVDALDTVRERMQRYRDDAQFEREHFEGPPVNIAHGKFHVADRAIELLDQVIASQNDQSG